MTVVLHVWFPDMEMDVAEIFELISKGREVKSW